MHCEINTYSTVRNFTMRNLQEDSKLIKPSNVLNTRQSRKYLNKLCIVTDQRYILKILEALSTLLRYIRLNKTFKDLNFLFGITNFIFSLTSGIILKIKHLKYQRTIKTKLIVKLGVSGRDL